MTPQKIKIIVERFLGPESHMSSCTLYRHRVYKYLIFSCRSFGSYTIFGAPKLID